MQKVAILQRGLPLSKTGKPFQEEQIMKGLAQLCSALEYIHKKKILHRDIKPENILLTKHDDIKLADFGISAFISQNGTYATSTLKTWAYASPEAFQEEPYTSKSEMWSLGVVIYELCALKRSFTGKKNLIKGEYEPISTLYSNTLRNIIASLLITDPKERISLSQLDKILHESMKSPEIQNEQSVRAFTDNQHLRQQDAVGLIL